MNNPGRSYMFGNFRSSSLNGCVLEYAKSVYHITVVEQYTKLLIGTFCKATTSKFTGRIDLILINCVKISQFSVCTKNKIIRGYISPLFQLFPAIY